MIIDWIPVKYHYITQEECDREGIDHKYIGDVRVDTPLPEPNTSILITTDLNTVTVEEVCEDEDGIYLEYYSWDEVKAWATMPTPYIERENFSLISALEANENVERANYSLQKVEKMINEEIEKASKRGEWSTRITIPQQYFRPANEQGPDIIRNKLCKLGYLEIRVSKTARDVNFYIVWREPVKNLEGEEPVIMKGGTF